MLGLPPEDQQFSITSLSKVTVKARLVPSVCFVVGIPAVSTGFAPAAEPPVLETEFVASHAATPPVFLAAAAPPAVGMVL